jgi:hypothetical protein
MSLKDKIQQDLNAAIREKKEVEVLVLRLIMAALLNKEKEKRFKTSKEKPDISEADLVKESQLTDDEAMAVISAEAKKRKEAIVEYEKGKRKDLAEKEKRELEVLQEYLPEQVSEEELKELVKEAIDKAGAKEMRDFGKIMTELMPKIQGRADGALISRIAKELLQSSMN